MMRVARGSLAAVWIAVLPAAACGGDASTSAPARHEAPAGPARAAGEAAGETSSTEETVDAVLYFVDETGAPAGEARSLPRFETPALQARALIGALAEGSRTGLAPVLPVDSAVMALHVQPDGTAYVDMNAAFEAGLSRGSEDALTAVRAIVETLAANVTGVRRVKILVEGEEPRALGGHLDLSRPLSPQGPLE